MRCGDPIASSRSRTRARNSPASAGPPASAAAEPAGAAPVRHPGARLRAAPSAGAAMRRLPAEGDRDVAAMDADGFAAARAGEVHGPGRARPEPRHVTGADAAVAGAAGATGIRPGAGGVQRPARVPAAGTGSGKASADDRQHGGSAGGPGSKAGPSPGPAGAVTGRPGKTAARSAGPGTARLRHYNRRGSICRRTVLPGVMYG